MILLSVGNINRVQAFIIGCIGEYNHLALMCWSTAIILSEYNHWLHLSAGRCCQPHISEWTSAGVRIQPRVKIAHTSTSLRLSICSYQFIINLNIRSNIIINLNITSSIIVLIHTIAIYFLQENVPNLTSVQVWEAAKGENSAPFTFLTLNCH